MKNNPSSGQSQSPDEVLKHERSLKKPDDGGDQEQAQMKEKFDQLSISADRSPESGKNPNLEFPGKSICNALDNLKLQSHEEVLKYERSLKKPMVYDDQERAKFDWMPWNQRPSNGIVFREPESGKNPNLEFPAKSKYNADGEDTLKTERSLKKPMVYYDDGVQERAQMKAMFDWMPWNQRPSNGIVFREPESGKNPNLEFPAKSKYNADEDTLKNERSLKKPMVYYDDGVQERAQRKATSDWIHSSNGFEHTLDCPAKSKCSADARKGKNKHMKSRKQKQKRALEPLTEDVLKKIEEKAREEGEDDLKVVLVIQKVLQMSDTMRQQNRITIPLAMLENPFLTLDEDQWLGERNGTISHHMTVPIMEPSGSVPSLNLRRWTVGKTSVAYVLNGDWFDVVLLNQLREGMTVQMWAFWIRGQLNFALVVLPDEDEGEVEIGPSKSEDTSES